MINYKQYLHPNFSGGYAFVFIAQDVQGGQDFALKVSYTYICFCIFIFSI